MGVDKKVFFGILFLVVSVAFVFAAVQSDGHLSSPISYGNYTGTLNLTANTSLTAGVLPMNVTFCYNASGGAVATSTNFTTMTNTSAGQNNFTSGTFDVSGYTDGTTYNISAYFDNGTDQEWALTSALNVTIDNTAPVIAYSATTQADYANVSRNAIYVNVSVTETNQESLVFNLFYSNHTLINRTQFYVVNTTAANYSINWTSGLLNTTYIYNVTINDTAGTSATAAARRITLDTVNPATATLSCSPSSVQSGQSVTCTCSGTDANTGVSSVSGSTVFTESTPGTYTVTAADYCTVTDYAGNTLAASTDATYTVTTGGSPASTTTSTKTWTKTFTASDDALAEGYTKQMAVKNRATFKVGGSTHQVGVKSLTANTVTIEIASDPQEATLNVGDERKFDVDGDGVYDLMVSLLSIESGKAEMTLLAISEDVSDSSMAEEQEKENAAQDQSDTDQGTPSDDEGSLMWLWVIIGILVLVGVGAGIAKSRK